MSIKDLMDPVYANLEAPDFKGYEEFRSRNDIDFFGWADPFFPDPSIPETVKKGIIESLETNASHYTLPIGDIKMREAVARRVKEINGIEVDPNKNIIITSGSDLSYNYAMRPFLLPGEENEVLTPTPSYSNSYFSPMLMGGRTVEVPTYAEDNYELRIDEFEKRLTSKTKIVVLVNPNNPTGNVYSKETIEKIADFVIKHNLILFIDQCFEDSVYDGNEMFQVMTIPGMFERTILVSSFSKGMGLCGLRLGYIVGHEDIIGVLQCCAVNFVGAPNTMVQAGILAALTYDNVTDQLKKEFQERTLECYELLKDIPNVYCHKPQAGFYLWLETDKLGSTDQICEYLLENAKVAVSSGNMFGTLGKKGVRIIVGAKRDRQECLRVVKRIRDALINYPANRN